MFLTPADLAVPELTADIVVIGAGAAGIAITQALHACGRDVLLVEGGSFDIEPAAQQLFDSRSIGEPMNPLDGRYRTFGGTTVAWTGRCAPLDPLDFEARAWVPDSGWPIAYADVARYYGAASELVGLPAAWAARPPKLDAGSDRSGRPATVEPFAWKYFATERDTFRHFGQMVYNAFEASRTLRILTHADLVALEPDAAAGGIGAARLTGRGGASVRVRGRTWVLACGGIENARLLLNFAEQVPEPFAAVAPMLGRCFMQHPRATTATIAADAAQARALQRRFNLFRRRGLHYETGAALSEPAQRQRALLNASAVLRYARRPDRRGSLFGALAAARRRALGHEPLLADPAITLQVDVEQVPDRDSRVLLLPDRDALGLRKAAIDWRIGALDRRTAAALTRGVTEWIAALGLGEGRAVADLDATGGLVPEHMSESLHHLGATRMASSPADGVVDGDLRVHGIRNLHVCGGSVFPTGGHANPTLTILALALRLAAAIGSR